MKEGKNYPLTANQKLAKTFRQPIRPAQQIPKKYISLCC